jgi:hypothetical protein
MTRKTTAKVREDQQATLEELESVCEKLQIKVVHAELTGEGMSTGGLCKVMGEWRIILDKRAAMGERISVLARALAGFDLEQVYVSPKARALITRHTPSSAPPG